MEQSPSSPYEQPAGTPPGNEKDGKKKKKSAEGDAATRAATDKETSPKTSDKESQPQLPKSAVDKLIATVTGKAPEAAEPKKPDTTGEKPDTQADDNASERDAPETDQANETPDDVERIKELATEPLSEEERPLVVAQLSEARQEAIAGELSELRANGAAPEALAAAEAADQLHSAIQQGLEEGKPADTATEAAYTEITGEPLNLEIPEEAAEAGAMEPDQADTDVIAHAYERGVDDVNEPVEQDDSQAADGTGGVPPRRRGFGFMGFPFGRAGGGAAEVAPAASTTEPETVVVASRLNLPLIIAAYLWGRRRGRIRTEKKLKPSLDQLKHIQGEVKRMEVTLAATEAKVRAYAWENEARKHQAAAAEATAQPTSEATRTPEPARPVTFAETAHATAPAPEAQRVESANVVIRAEQLSEHEVLEIAKNIRVGERGEQSAADLYLNHSIGRRGLDSIVNAHLRGEDLTRVVTEELLAFERDPSFHTIKQFDETNPKQATVIEPIGASASAPQMAADQQPTPQVPVAAQESSRSSTRAAPKALVVANIVAVIVLAALIVVGIAIWLLHR